MRFLKVLFWLLLGGLEAFGGLTLAEGTTEVVHGNISSSVSMRLGGKLNALELALSVIPVGKILEPVSKVLKKYSSKLNPLTKSLRKYAAEIATSRSSTRPRRSTWHSLRTRISERCRWRSTGA